MKKFFNIIVAIKSMASLVFLGQVMAYVVIGSFFGISSITFSFIWQIIFISLLSSVIQLLSFSELVIKKMRYSKRLLIFCILLLAMLASFATIFKWFPTGNIVSWLIFMAIFLFFFVIITLGFQIYFKTTGRKYTEMLDAYKSNKKE